MEGVWLCSPIVHAPLGGNTEGAYPWCPTRHQDGSGSVKMLPVVERIIRFIMAVVSPAPVVIGSRCPAQPVDYRTG